MLFGDASHQGEREHKGKHDEANNYVSSMKTNQGVIRGSEEIGLYRQAFVVDEVIPLLRGGDEKDGSEENGACQVDDAGAEILFPQRADREMNGDAAREQADGAEYGQLQYLRRSRATEAFADVEDVGDDEDDEDCGFGHDEADHSHSASVG